MSEGFKTFVMYVCLIIFALIWSGYWSNWHSERARINSDPALMELEEEIYNQYD